MLNRLAKVRKSIRNLKLDALFISNQHNVSYLTGIVGLAADEREAFLLLTKKQMFFFAFATHYGLYKDTQGIFSTLCITPIRKLNTMLNEIIEKENLRIIGYEKESLTISELESLKSKVRAKFRGTKNIIETQRIIKDEGELNLIKKAATITDLAFNYIIQRIKTGKSEKELSLELEFFIRERADDTAFAPIVAFNQNAAIPHYLPSHQVKLKARSIILFDFGARVAGYCSDMTRVVFYGTPNGTQLKTYNIVLAAQKLAFSKIKTGLTGSQIDKVARDYIKSTGYPEYQHGLGHGVGLAIHEDPRLNLDDETVLKENMVVTIEPGIYIEGSCGIRIEDLIVLKRDGIEILTKSPKNLIII